MVVSIGGFCSEQKLDGDFQIKMEESRTRLCVACVGCGLAAGIVLKYAAHCSVTLTLYTFSRPVQPGAQGKMVEQNMILCALREQCPR